MAISICVYPFKNIILFIYTDVQPSLWEMTLGNVRTICIMGLQRILPFNLPDYIVSSLWDDIKVDFNAISHCLSLLQTDAMYNNTYVSLFPFTLNTMLLHSVRSG